MKILVIQITRLGDILCTLPAVAALRRENPLAEIHFLARRRFAMAVEGQRAIDHVWCLDSQKVLGPLIEDGNQLLASAQVLRELITSLRAEKFDAVINLSFSPASSFITHLVARAEIPVRGYTRTSDLYLHIPDQPSRYFRAQVGLDKSNRVHISDILAWIAGVPLKAVDRRMGAVPKETPRAGVVCHLGSSQAQKTWPAAYWISYLERLSADPGRHITLIGGAEEKNLAANICLQVGPRPNISNLAGTTSFRDLYSIIGSAQLYVGADSGPLHIANLTQCLALNLSVGDVRFWETGPTTKGSRVLVSRQPEFLSSDKVFEQTVELLTGKESRAGYVECVRESGVYYDVHDGADVRPDSWPLVEWMHFDGDRPAVGKEVVQALRQIHEICALAEQQLEVFYHSPAKTEIVGILDRLDQLLEIMRENITPLSPLLEEFKTDKENIKPGTREEIFCLTKSCYQRLAKKALLLEPGRDENVERNPVA